MNRFDLFRSPLLPALVAVLALNDFVLKPAFHNWVTGKLSDFAGLAAFTIFLLAIWPRRGRLVGASVAILFVFWKSPWSQGVIDLVNAVSPLSIGRTVDWSDLIALTAVGLMCRTAHRLPLVDAGKLGTCLTAGGCLVAFAASIHIAGAKGYGHSHMAEIPTPVTGSSLENEVLSLFDDVAGRNALKCSRCAPLDMGRSYLGIGGGQIIGSGDLEVSFDSSRRVIYYRVLVYLREPPRAEDAPLRARVDAINAEIESELRKRFPTVIIGKMPPPSPTTYRSVRVKVAQKEEAQRVAAMVGDFFQASGFRQDYQSETMRIFVQPPPVSASKSALQTLVSLSREGFTVMTELRSNAPGYSKRQAELFEALRRKLSLEFGEKNVFVERSN
jgi:hypothetical protein